MIRGLIVLGKLLTAMVRPPPVRKSKPRHWYPRYWHPENPHVCYYCGRFDQEEVELTDPPCEGMRRIKF